MPGVTAVRTGHGVGKTAIAAGIAQWALSSFPSCAVITTAPTWRQVEELLWREIASQQSRARFPLGGDSGKTFLNLGPECFGFGLSTDKPDRFQGMHGVGSKEWGVNPEDPNRPVVVVIVDEACGVPREIMDAVKAITVGPLDRVIAIGNPTDPDSAFADYFNGVSRARKIHVSSWEAARFGAAHGIPGLTSLEWCEERKRDWGEGTAVYAARVLGNFPQEHEDALIKLAWVERANRRYERRMRAGEYGDPLEHSWGLDIARHGADKTVWWHRIVDARFTRLDKCFKRDDNDITEAAGLTVRYMRKYGTGAVVTDDTGVGGGVTDILLENGYDVAPVNFGANPIDTETYDDKRTELWWHMRDLLRHNRIDLAPHDDTMRDLCAPIFGTTSKGKLKMEPKEKTKKRLGGRSPDFGDAACLAASGESDSVADGIEGVSKRSDDLDRWNLVPSMRSEPL